MILAGVDESVTASRAGSYAAGLARRQGARLVIVYVQTTGSYVITSSAGASVLAAEAQVRSEIADELSALAEQRARELGIAMTFITTQGDPFREISRIAQETRADAIVVGASVKAGHRLLGSLAVRLVRAGKWPVTVVP